MGNNNMNCRSCGQRQTNIPENEKPIAKKIIDLRSEIKDAIYRVFPDETGSLAAALILGDRSGLSAEVLGNFGKVGITHIICVSGLHLSLWSMLIIGLLRKTGINKRLSSLAAAVCVVGFMFLTGFTYSVIRAGIMMLVFLLGDVMLKRTDSLNSLGFALTAIATVNPFAVGAVGLQLSAQNLEEGGFSHTVGTAYKEPVSGTDDKANVIEQLLRRKRLG